MNVTGGEYGKMAKKASPPTNKTKNCCFAFVIGGLVCALGEGFGMIYEKIGIGADDVKALVPITLIVIAAVLTALGVFDKIAYYAGAGTIVPITGFANSIVLPFYSLLLSVDVLFSEVAASSAASTGLVLSKKTVAKR